VNQTKSQQDLFWRVCQIGDREDINAKSFDRYLVGEPSITYTVEIKLLKGFMFGEYQFVQARLKLPGMVDNKTVSSSKFGGRLITKMAPKRISVQTLNIQMLLLKEGTC
jgi:hypothetical protein